MIIPAKHKCPRCGEEWRMLANVPNDQAPQYGRNGDGVISRLCARCESKGSR